MALKPRRKIASDKQILLFLRNGRSMEIQ